MAYNEAANQPRTAHARLAALRALPLTWELLIIDDGSTDATGALADGLAAADEGVRSIHHVPNRGLGGVYRTGFAEAKGRWLSFFPADGQFPAEILGQFWPKTADHDVILGYLPERPGEHLARLFSGAERGLYRLLFGGFPRFQGIFMVRTALLCEVPLVSEGRGWSVVMELLLRLHRGPHRLCNVPTRVRPRLSGHSKVLNIPTIYANVAEVVRLRAAMARGQGRPARTQS